MPLFCSLDDGSLANTTRVTFDDGPKTEVTARHQHLLSLDFKSIFQVERTLHLDLPTIAEALSSIIHRSANEEFKVGEREREREREREIGRSREDWRCQELLFKKYLLHPDGIFEADCMFPVRGRFILLRYLRCLDEVPVS